MRMNKKKSLYEAPTTDVLVVRFEGAILTISGDGDPNAWTKGNTNWFDDED